MLSQVFAFSGRLARVSDVVNKAEDLARSGDKPISIVQATAIRAIIALMRRDYALCLEAAEDEALVSHAHGFVRWLAHRMLMTGIGRVFNHGDIGSLDAAKRGIDDWKATGAKLYVPTFCAYLADSALHFGREDMARLAVDDGIAQATINHGHLVLSELQRLDALIHERSGAVDDALTRLEMPIASSQRQGAWLFHLHGCRDRVRIQTDRALPMGAAVEALSEAPDRVQEFRSGPNWQRGLTVAAQATARIVGAAAIH